MADVTDDGTASETHYLLKDHLGSVETITDEGAAVIERTSFDAPMPLALGGASAGPRTGRRWRTPRSRSSRGQRKNFSRSCGIKPRDPGKKARKAYLRLFTDRIDLESTEVRIRGSKAVLAQAAASDTPVWYRVPSFDRKWWARQDANAQ